MKWSPSTENYKISISQAQWFIPVIPALRRQRPDDYYKIKVNSIYKAISRQTRVIARNDLQQQNKTNKNSNYQWTVNLKMFYIMQYLKYCQDLTHVHRTWRSGLAVRITGSNSKVHMVAHNSSTSVEGDLTPRGSLGTKYTHNA